MLFLIQFSKIYRIEPALMLDVLVDAAQSG